MATYKLVLTRPGYNATDSSVARKNYIFHSDNNSFKVARVLSFSGAGSQAHGFTYPPTVIYYRELATGKWYGGNDGYNLGGSSTINCDSTNVYYTDSVNCYVFVLVDPLNE